MMERDAGHGKRDATGHVSESRVPGPEFRGRA
jgi:hypothetical protein